MCAQWWVRRVDRVAVVWGNGSGGEAAWVADALLTVLGKRWQGGGVLRRLPGGWSAQALVLAKRVAAVAI